MDSKDHPKPTSRQPENEWTLVVGQHIEIYQNGQVIDRGQVEDVTSDGNVLWLQMEGAKHRRLVENYPGRHVKSLPTPATNQNDAGQ